MFGDPERISSILGLQATYTHVAGQLRPGPRFCNPWKESLWLLESPLDESEAVAAHLTWLLDILEPLHDKLNALQKEGCVMDLFLGVFRNQDQGTYVVPNKLLLAAGDLGLSLVLDVY